jgi:hypothetical protein
MRIIAVVQQRHDPLDFLAVDQPRPDCTLRHIALEADQSTPTIRVQNRLAVRGRTDKLLRRKIDHFFSAIVLGNHHLLDHRVQRDDASHRRLRGRNQQAVVAPRVHAQHGAHRVAAQAVGQQPFGLERALDARRIIGVDIEFEHVAAQDNTAGGRARHLLAAKRADRGGQCR